MIREKSKRKFKDIVRDALAYLREIQQLMQPREGYLEESASKLSSYKISITKFNMYVLGMYMYDILTL